MTKPLGPYTPAVRAGDWIIVSGQLGLKDGVLVEGGVPAQTAQAIGVAALPAGGAVEIEAWAFKPLPAGAQL